MKILKKSIRAIIHLPSLFERWERRRQIRKERLVIRGFDTRSSSAKLQHVLGRIKKGDVLWASSLIADEMGYRAALKFAEANIGPAQQLGVNLLRANVHLDSESRWLGSLNEYLTHLNLASVSLAERSGSRFSRLCVAETLPDQEGPLISVIMPAYNAELTLVQAANSILCQTWRNLELIIVDDCSTDGTWDLVQELAAKDPRVVTRRNMVNVGPYVSKNLALQIARGTYITGHDADDWSHPQRLARDIEPIVSSNGAVLATLSNMFRMNAHGELSRFAKISRSSSDGARRVSSISLMIDAKFLKDSLGGWDSVRFGADSEMIARVEKVLGDRFLRTDNVGMFCLDLETSLTNDPQFGVSKDTGISPTRMAYREAYLEWHSDLKESTALLPFPLVERKFRAPAVMLVSLEDVEHNLRVHQERTAASRQAGQGVSV